MLIVDDNKDICNMLSLLLSDKYKIMIAYDGEMAWNMIPDMQPDLVLSDIMMPGMNGLRTVLENQAGCKDISYPCSLAFSQDYIAGLSHRI